MRRYILSLVLPLFVLMLAALGCQTLTNGMPAAEKGVVTFHALMDDEKFSEIYDTSDERMKQSGPKEEIVEFLTAVRRKLGKVKSSTTENWQVQNYNMTSSIVLVQATEFENGKGNETFTFVIDGDSAKLSGYHISSNDMLIK